ncbi:glycosyltransferase [Mammaliicoccus sciuri]|uniref:glycosyltransferase n=1 Tax=Mammaliicoccus sciuri TaxID=1296 RepID=UPI002DBF5C3A|nr:glycosyltransferase [Mammaliicoccus sciuri]MEB7768751.1 glycosyltransferase [Mammaliicoccus sciuri]MEB7818592.1 glycosyltransferase [Mammaliicoccus sciuri]
MNIIYITSRLDKNHGGLTASLLNKTRILEENNKIGSRILSFHLDPNYNNVISEIKERYNLNENIKLINLNEFYRGNSVREEKKYYLNLESYTEVKIDKFNFEYYKEGIKYNEVKYNEKNICEVRFFNETNELYRKDVIDSQGFLYYTSYYLNNFLSRQIHYRKDGSIYLTREFDAKNGKDTIKSIVLFLESNIVKRFKNFDEFKKYFILEFIVSPITYLVGEARGLDSVILSINDSRVRKIFMTHSIHIRPDTDIIRAGNRPVLNNLNNIDSLVVLTEKQKNDIEKRFGKRDNYFVIPHSIDKKYINIDTEENKVVIVSRLHEEKNIDHAIRAFKKVVSKVPNAKLHVYGDGPEKEKLNQLIKKLNLVDNIKLKGYSSNIDNVLQSADCLILTSKYEGFGMVIQESIANGTPVIAYNIKYGPSDMIDDGKNGYLVSNSDENDLAEKIIKYLKLNESEKKMFSLNSIKKADEFSHANFSKKWIDLFKYNYHLKSKFETEIYLKNIKKVSLNKYKIIVEINVDGDLKEELKIKPKFYLRSSLDDLENKEYIVDEYSIIEKNANKYSVEIIFNSKSKDKNEIYDLSIEMKSDNINYEYRVGHHRENGIILKEYKGKKFKPYFTEKYGNLSFKK